MPVKIAVRSGEVAEARRGTLVFGVWREGKAKQVPPSALGPLAREPGLRDLISREEFIAKKDQTLAFTRLSASGAQRVVLYGLGDRGTFRSADARSFAAKAVRAATADKSAELTIVAPAGLDTFARALAEGVELGGYRFTKYLTGERAPKHAVSTVTLAFAKAQGRTVKSDIALGQAVGRAVNTARDLSNEPPNVLTPETLADAAREVARSSKLGVQIFDAKAILRRGMYLLHAVGRGSANEPRLIHITYKPAKRARARYVFVGKGITFDSGGLCIKPAAGMGEMKHDMSGAANIVGLMQGVAALQPPVEVHGIIAAAENMPDGNAYRPADILGSLDGKTVEIVNTDAEGRLILADALAYARELEPDLLVDNATLTGACVVALGNTCSGYYANNEEVARLFDSAVKSSGEQMWRMPLLEELRDQLKSDVADLKHTGDRWGGSITAALFLREFIGNTKNWAHADIAGPAMADHARGWDPKGGTGHGVLTFLQLVEQVSAQA